jgi:hypothetical protein
VIKVIDRGNFINETPACYITSPLIYMTYLLLNGFMSWFYIMNYLEAPSVNLKLLADNKRANGVIMVFSLVF